MIRIWGRISSINVRKVVWTAQELGLTVQRTDAGGHFGLVKEADYLGKNPNAMVPLLEDGDVTVWESNVIVRYLCAKYSPGGFYPSDLKARFLAEQWMDWQQTTLNPAGRGAFIQLVRTPAEQRDADIVAQSRFETEALLDILDAHLARHAFMGGEQFGMADIPVACEMHRWFGLPQPRSARASLDRWYQAILARPATRGVLDLALS
ncbi:MAG: glutathione S-transferase [Comamonadaceae bacterium]|nr:MAG: glutathione S-transferase [Comamonadaceae bacterium]